MTADDDGENDERLRSLRAVWLSMPDEDPPERGLMELMAAARAKAEVMTQPSMWQRFIDLLKRPPVMALATIMILVGGAVFVVNRKDKLAHAPTAEQPALQQETGGQVNTVTPMSEDRGKLEGPGGTGEATPDLSTATPPAEKAPEKDKPLYRPQQKKAAPQIGSATTVKKPPAKASTATTKGKVDVSGGDGFGETNGLLLDGRESPKNEEPKKMIKESEDAEADFSPSAPTGGKSPEPHAESKPTADKVTSSTTTTKPPAASASQLHAQARSAAARGDCAGARATASRIAKIDAGYYKTNVATDKSLSKCVTTAAE